MDLVAIITGVFIGVAVTLLGQGAQTALRKSARVMRSKKAEISLTLDGPLRGFEMQPGLLYIRDGRDEVDEKSSIVNKTVRFEATGTPGEFIARFRRSSRIGCQFKIFFDAAVADQDELIAALVHVGFVDPSTTRSIPGRVWVIDPRFDTCTTVDGFENNYLTALERLD